MDAFGAAAESERREQGRSRSHLHGELATCSSRGCVALMRKLRCASTRSQMEALAELALLASALASVFIFDEIGYIRR